MSGQEQERRQDRRPDEEPPEAPAPVPQARDQQREQEVDDLLAEIDDVLETNAEEFVHGFVQKGGQ
jgi:prokaryotic ubiquitin-like protein Pup